MNWCQYSADDSAWDPECVKQRDAEIRYLPPNWQDLVDIKPLLMTEKPHEECAELLQLKSLRTARLKEIEYEATLPGAIAGVLAVADPNAHPVKLKTIEMISEALQEISRPTFVLKNVFNRGRPRQCCEMDLDPMFRSEKLDPLHPAYPSGHSTQTHTVAFLLAKLVPTKEPALVKAAQRTARNREIAGLHYQSDSAAGARLARQLVDLLLVKENTFFNKLFVPAQREWP